MRFKKQRDQRPQPETPGEQTDKRRQRRCRRKGRKACRRLPAQEESASFRCVIGIESANDTRNLLNKEVILK